MPPIMEGRENRVQKIKLSFISGTTPSALLGQSLPGLELALDLVLYLAA